MLLNLLSTDNIVNFNIKLADIIGLHPAIYVQALLNVNEKAYRKNMLVDDTFSLDREYITTRTTLSIKEQQDIDKVLESLGVISFVEDRVKLDLEVLTTLLSADFKLATDIKTKVTKLSKSTRKTKAEKMVDNLKSNVKVPTDEMREVYYRWIEAVCEKRGWMSSSAVVEAQRVVNDFCKNNWNIAYRIVDIGAINGWMDLTWAINRYKQESSNVNSYRINAPAVNYTQQNYQQVSEVVF